MPSKNLNIRPLSWRLSPELVEAGLTPQFYGMRLPHAWKETLLTLQAESTGKDRSKASVPCKGLHSALLGSIGDLLVIEPNAWRLSAPNENWLITDKQIDPELIYDVVVTWATFMWGNFPGHIQSLANLSTSDLEWIPFSPNLADWGQCDNGTAKPNSPHFFRLLPHYIAGSLSQQGVQLKIGTSHRELRRCAQQDLKSRVAEVMTWPPETFSYGKTVAYYCITLKFTAQTVPFQPFPVIHCEVGVRRWRMPKAKYQRGNASVYLHNNVPWLPKSHRTTSFPIASAKWQKIAPGKYELVWRRDSYLVDLLNKLHAHPPLPVANALIQNPTQYFNTSGSLFAGIVHSTRMGSHPVGAGVFPRDLREVGEQLNVLLSSLGLEWTSAPKRITIPTGFSVPFKDYFARVTETKDGLKENASITQEHRRENTPMGDTDELHIELFYQSENTRVVFERHLRQFFGISDEASFPFKLGKDKWLHFAPQLLGAVGSKLDEPAGRTAYQKRCNEIHDFFKAQNSALPLHPTLSLVELGDKSAFDEEDDPKNAIRAGFAACGRLTQFIAVPEQPFAVDKRSDPINSALLDGMRQLGLAAQLPPLPKVDLPDSMTIMSLWICKNCPNSDNKTYGTFPIWLRMNIDNGRIEVKAFGFTKWLPYREAQLVLANPQSAPKPLLSNDSRITSFIEDTLREVNDQTVVYCDAQNSRNFWKWLPDSRITPDTIGFHSNTPYEPLTAWPGWSGLRVIRVRDYKDGETPQHFAPKDIEAEEIVGITSGLFAFGDTNMEGMGAKSNRVFGSLPLKPPQFTGQAVGMSRWGSATGKNAWNPRLLEITTAVLQPGDSPELWAALTHRLRDSSAHYGSETALPWPLHLAKKMEEYVLPI